MHLIGLTGGIASGKSSVSAVLEEFGCPIIDADLIAREVVRPGCPSWKLIVEYFGRDVLLPGCDELDRAKLGKMVFGNEAKRKKLNSFTHPHIQRSMLWGVVKNFFKGESFVVIVSPLLFESGAYTNKLNKIVVVSCTEEQQVERLMARDSLSKEDALQRVNAQMPLFEKLRKADIVLDNSFEESLLRQQACNLYYDLVRMTAYQRQIRRVLVVMLSITLFVYFLL